MRPSHSIGTTVKPAKQNPAFGQNEVRSIDWLSRSNETLIRIGRPAPSDEQLVALQVAVIRFLARLKGFLLNVSAASPAGRSNHTTDISGRGQFGWKVLEGDPGDQQHFCCPVAEGPIGGRDGRRQD